MATPMQYQSPETKIQPLVEFSSDHNTNRSKRDRDTIENEYVAHPIVGFIFDPRHSFDLVTSLDQNRTALDEQI